MCLLFFVLLLGTLAAEEAPEISLVDQIESPVSRVVGSVNVISGHLVDQSIHSELTGPDPYVVAHSYVSAGDDQGSLADGWDLYHPSELHVSQPQGLSCLTPKSYDNDATLFYRDAGGATIVFKGDHHARHFSPRIKKTGYAFMSSIEAPCRRDIRKTSIWWDAAQDRWMVRLSDGTLRKYKSIMKFLFRPQFGDPNYKHKAYRIEEETFPTGNVRKYTYNSDHDLEEIRTLSSKGRLIHKIQFYWKKDHVAIGTSDGRWVKFSLKKLPHRTDAFAVTEVFRPGKPRLRYSYLNSNSRRVATKWTGDGFYENVHYYSDDENEFCKSKVRSLYTKRFKEETPFRSHAFSYRKWQDYTRTRVKEIDGAFKSYIWDKNKRPVWVTCFSKDKKRLQAEHFIWGEDDDEGRLKSRVIFDEQKKPLVAKEYIYDKYGNVVEEKLRGSFTGKEHAPLFCDKDKEPRGGEVVRKYASYNDRWLKTSETDPLGNKTYFTYEKKRDLLTARFTCEGEKIIKREFFSYDDAGIQVEVILDDGSSKEKKNLQSVTKRFIKRIQPRTKAPRYGAPEEESEYVWTEKGGEKLLRKKILKRDRKGRVLRERVYDAAKNLVKVFKYEYDDLDRVIHSFNKFLGREEKFSYDSHGRLATKSSPESSISYNYDLFNRLIEEKTTFPDGTSTSVCHEYDASGRVETTIDARGRTTTKVHDIASRLSKNIGPALLTEEGVKRGEEAISYAGEKEKHFFPTGAFTEIEKSGFGKPLVSTNTFGAKTFFYYDAKGRLIEQTDPTGLTTCYEYDALDRPTKIFQSSGGARLSEFTKEYRGASLVNESFPTKQILYTYDDYGRKKSEKTVDLVTLETLTNEFEYDSRHRPVCVRQVELGVEEHIRYDDEDHEIERKKLSLDGKLLTLTTKTYDTSGRIIEEGVGRAGKIAKTTTKWGAYGLVESITYPDGTQRHFSYAPLFRADGGGTYLRKVVTDSRGVVTEELLDSNDVAVSTTVKDPFGTIVATKKVFLSLLGKPTLLIEDEIFGGVKKGSVSTRLEYDSTGNVTACEYASGTSDAAAWKYSYDMCGRKVQEEKPSGVLLKSIYDEKSRLVQYASSDGSVSWKYLYNAQDLPEKIINEITGGETLRSYDGLGHLLREVFESGISLSYDVASTGLFRSLTYPDGSKTFYSSSSGLLSTVERKGYKYTVLERDNSGAVTKSSFGTWGELIQRVDIMGRKTLMSSPGFCEERKRFDPVGFCLERNIDTSSETFSYDALGQLTCDNGRISSYDSLYRRVEHQGKSSLHNARHQLVKQGDVAYTYDKDGRRVKDEAYSYFYDALDRLTALENETQRIEYAYDSFHRRLSEKRFLRASGEWHEDSYTNYLWQGEDEIGSYDKEGKNLSLRVLGEGKDIGSAVLFELGGNCYIPLHDIGGNVRALVNDSGDIAERLSYNAFGVESRTGTLSPWTFSSKREDPTGLIYFGRRYYDSACAVWLTQDPLGQGAGPNLYHYVKNNPLLLFDSFGLAEEMTSADRGFLGNLWQGVTTVFDSLFGSHQSAAPSTAQSSIEMPSEVSKEGSPPLMRFVLDDETTVYASRDYKDQLVIHHFGKDFFKDFEGQNLQKGVVFYLNGANQSLYRCYSIAEQIKNENEQVKAVVLVYNATKGLGPDIGEAAANIFHIPTRVVDNLRSEVNKFFAECFAHSITFHGIYLHWSQGAAIGALLWNYPEFRSEGAYEKYSGTKATFGGAVLFHDGPNFVATGDPVPYLSPGNALGLLHPQEFGYDIRFLERQSGGCTHDFTGPEYHTALNNFLRQELGG